MFMVLKRFSFFKDKMLLQKIIPVSSGDGQYRLSPVNGQGREYRTSGF